MIIKVENATANFSQYFLPFFRSDFDIFDLLNELFSINSAISLMFILYDGEVGKESNFRIDSPVYFTTS